eukprot:4121301-Prymnesium_polylepis.1
MGASARRLTGLDALPEREDALGAVDRRHRVEHARVAPLQRSEQRLTHQRFGGGLNNGGGVPREARDSARDVLRDASPRAAASGT